MLIGSVGRMQIKEWIVIHDTQGYSQTEDFKEIKGMLTKALLETHNPPGSGKFLLRPSTANEIDAETNKRKGKRSGRTVNGVKAIKTPFMDNLSAISSGWRSEQKVDLGLGECDITYFYDDERLPFVVEWETGNISSTHRAVNRILTTILRGFASGGVLILPSREMYPHLTDRVGNSGEIQGYLDLWRKADNLSDKPYFFAFVVIEHDELSNEVPYFAAGNDGNSFRVSK